MKFLKNNLKVIIAFIIGIILAGGIVYAATVASGVTYTTAKNSNVKNVEDALNDLYAKLNNELENNTEWEEVNDAFVTNPNYSLNEARLFKKGNICKLTVVVDYISKDTSYSLINNEKYYPNENISVYGWGVGNGMAGVTLKTDGTFVVTSQTQNWGTGWAAIKNICYYCNE